MADDFETLMKARVALARKRFTFAQTIATSGDVAEGAMKALIEIQHAIDVIDRAIEEQEDADELEAEEEE